MRDLARYFTAFPLAFGHQPSGYQAFRMRADGARLYVSSPLASIDSSRALALVASERKAWVGRALTGGHPAHHTYLSKSPLTARSPKCTVTAARIRVVRPDLENLNLGELHAVRLDTLARGGAQARPDNPNVASHGRR